MHWKTAHRSRKSFRQELARWFSEKPDTSRWIVIYDPKFAAFQQSHDPVKVAFSRLRERIERGGSRRP